MGKITLTNIAEELAHKSGLSKDAADNFMRAIVDTIEKGLREDNIVKIKGLGTFKLMEVSDRGSIDVNTGESITIKGYTKVTFTPDSAMKEFVNRPFAHFEPTELNEGFQDEELVVSEEQVATNIEEGEDAASTPLPVDMAPEENTDNTEDAALQPAEEKVEETATETAATDTEEIPVQEEVAESENNDSIEIVITENIESIEMETVDNTEDTETAKEETAIVQATEQEQTTETEEVSADLQPEDTTSQDLQPENKDIAEETTATDAKTEEAKSEEKETETKAEEARADKPKSRRGCRAAGCLFGIFIILAAMAVCYFVEIPTNEKETLDGQTEITVNPNLEKDLEKNWEDATLATDNTPADTLPSHNETEEVHADSKEALPSNKTVETEKVEQKSTTTAATIVTTATTTSNSYTLVAITESLAAKSIKDITIADTTDYTIGSTLTKHELKSGETIIQLARKYYGDKRLWPYIVKYNNITDFNKVAVGMIIEIPVLNSKE